MNRMHLHWPNHWVSSDCDGPGLIRLAQDNKVGIGPLQSSLDNRLRRGGWVAPRELILRFSMRSSIALIKEILYKMENPKTKIQKIKVLEVHFKKKKT